MDELCCLMYFWLVSESMMKREGWDVDHSQLVDQSHIRFKSQFRWRDWRMLKLNFHECLSASYSILYCAVTVTVTDFCNLLLGLHTVDNFKGLSNLGCNWTAKEKKKKTKKKEKKKKQEKDKYRLSRRCNTSFLDNWSKTEPISHHSPQKLIINSSPPNDMLPLSLNLTNGMSSSWVVVMLVLRLPRLQLDQMHLPYSSLILGRR